MDNVKHLRTKTVPITEKLMQERAADIKRIIDHLKEYMEKHPGAPGISAVQYGVPLPIFVFRRKKKGKVNEPEIVICVNPTVIKWSGKANFSSEICLSFPGLMTRCERDPKIKVKYYTIDAEYKFSIVQERLQGPTAITFQHHLDFLEGKIMFDKAIMTTKWLDVFSKVCRVPSESFGFDYFIAGQNKLFFSGLSAVGLDTDQVVGIYFGEEKPAPKEEEAIIKPVGVDDKNYEQTQSGLYIPKGK